MSIIDLRSDFLSLPSAAMRAAAEKAWDSRCFGLREDPWQQQLETRLAALLGKEDALIFPTCSMANTVAMMAQCLPGSTVLCPPDAHVLLSEGNAAAALAGLSLRGVIASPSALVEGWLAPVSAWAESLAAAPDEQRSPVAMCVLENTHNRAGGWVLPRGYVDAVGQAAHAAGAALHMDGARLLYAAAALGTPPAQLVAGCDSVALSLNKHTGSPIAAALVGSRALIARALVLRQRLGGGLRPVGAACAAALQGLDELDELQGVVARTRRLAEGLSGIAPFTVNEPERCTNLVVLQLPDGGCAERALAAFTERGVLAMGFGPARLRLALHRGIGDAQVDRVLATAVAIAPFFEPPPAGGHSPGEMKTMSCRVGIDIGGTFTDFALFDDDRKDVTIHKALTTPAEPEQAVLAGITALAERAGVAISDISLVVHGTTLVTNAAIERRGTPTAMLVTRGFRDVLDIAMEQRYDLYDMRIRFPAPLVARNLRIEVDERMDGEGKVRSPLSLENLEQQVRDAVEQHGVRSIAVCLMHSYVNDAHEQRLGAWLAEKFPGLRVSLSSVVFPFAREYQRWTTTCLNAYVQPLVDDYVNRLERGLSMAGFKGEFFIMSSSGSTLTPEMARKFPVRLLESGPAAGALMSARHSEWLKRPQILSFDMGGTTAKGCVVLDHTPLKRYDFEVGRVHDFKRGSGLPVKIPVIDMIEIGSGGGSIADLDDRGVVRVGPRSASSVPGPACYARGGVEPTLTDANLVLGYLDAKSFLGGKMALDVAAAESAIGERIGKPLGTDAQRAAWGIHEVINEDVAKAFRVHASERGVDYRRCSMIVFGGSGPLHGARIARKLRVPQVICPNGAGVMSAFGLLSSPVGFEMVQSLRISLDALSAERYLEIVHDLEKRVRAEFKGGSMSLGEGTLQLKLDMRYLGQGYEVEVDIPDPGNAAVVGEISALFNKAYAAIFGQSFEDKEVEIVAWKAEVQGEVPGDGTAYRLRSLDQMDGAALKGHRPAYCAVRGSYVSTPVYDRYRLQSGDVVDGPALIEESESTCVIALGDQAVVDAQGNLIINIESNPS